MSIQNKVQGSTIFKMNVQEADKYMGYSLKRNLESGIQPKAMQQSLHVDNEEFSYLLPSINLIIIAKRENHTHRTYNK